MGHTYQPVLRPALVILFISLVPAISQGQGRLVFTSSQMVMGGGSPATPIYLTIGNSSTAAVVITETGHIITSNEYARIKWAVGTNTGDFVFPTSNGTTYVPLVLRITTAGAGAGAATVATWFAPNNTDVPDGGYVMCPNEASAIDRFWDVRLSGYTTDPLGHLIFTYDPAELDGIPEPLLRAQRGDATLLPACPWASPTGTVNTALDQVDVTGIPRSAPWTLSNAAIPLPVELLSFTAQWQDEHHAVVDLDWTTASEVNNAFFEVQRSEDALVFEPMDIVAAIGNSSAETDYHAEDHAPLANGVSYYRLRQVDNDGAFTYSPVRSVSAASAPQPLAILSVYPNPASDYFVCDITSTEERTIVISLVDMLQQTVLRRGALVHKGTSSFRIPTSRFSQGTYVLQIIDTSNKEAHTKLVIR
jgi:Secretion system C-terminal sorting domain